MPEEVKLNLQARLEAWTKAYVAKVQAQFRLKYDKTRADAIYQLRRWQLAALKRTAKWSTSEVERLDPPPAPSDWDWLSAQDLYLPERIQATGFPPAESKPIKMPRYGVVTPQMRGDAPDQDVLGKDYKEWLSRKSTRTAWPDKAINDDLGPKFPGPGR